MAPVFLTARFFNNLGFARNFLDKWLLDAKKSYSLAIMPKKIEKDADIKPKNGQNLEKRSQDDEQTLEKKREKMRIAIENLKNSANTNMNFKFGSMSRGTSSSSNSTFVQATETPTLSLMEDLTEDKSPDPKTINFNGITMKTLKIKKKVKKPSIFVDEKIVDENVKKSNNKSKHRKKSNLNGHNLNLVPNSKRGGDYNGTLPSNKLILRQQLATEKLKKLERMLQRLEEFPILDLGSVPFLYWGENTGKVQKNVNDEKNKETEKEIADKPVGNDQIVANDGGEQDYHKFCGPVSVKNSFVVKKGKINNFFKQNHNFSNPDDTTNPNPTSDAIKPKRSPRKYLVSEIIHGSEEIALSTLVALVTSTLHDRPVKRLKLVFDDPKNKKRVISVTHRQIEIQKIVNLIGFFLCSSQKHDNHKNSNDLQIFGPRGGRHNYSGGGGRSSLLDKMLGKTRCDSFGNMFFSTVFSSSNNDFISNAWKNFTNSKCLLSFFCFLENESFSNILFLQIMKSKKLFVLHFQMIIKLQLKQNSSSTICLITPISTDSSPMLLNRNPFVNNTIPTDLS